MEMLRNKKGQDIIFSFIATILLMVVVYVFDNFSYPFGEHTGDLTILESFIHRSHRTQFDRDSVLFLNTGYELDLVHTDHGVETVTDRRFLTQLLADIQTTGYRYVFMDIRLESGYNSDCDSVDVALVNQIGSMRDVIVARHWDYKRHEPKRLIDSSLQSCSAYCDYTSSVFNTAFERYQYLQPGGASAALRIYQDLEVRKIKSHKVWSKSLFFSDRHSLCLNCLFIGVSEDFGGPRSREDGTPKYWNLSEDFYGERAAFGVEDLQSLCEGKIVVIGNFVDDVHDTYRGRQPGAYLHYLAYENLKDGRHRLPWWYILLVAIVFWIIFFLSVNQKKPWQYVPFIRKSKNKLLHFVLSLIDNTILLTIVSWLLYTLFMKPLSIFIPVVVFTITDTIFKYRDYEV